MRIDWKPFLQGYGTGVFINIVSLILDLTFCLVLTLVINHIGRFLPKNPIFFLVTICLAWFCILSFFLWIILRRRSLEPSFRDYRLGLLIGGYSFTAITVPVTIVLLAFWIFSHICCVM